MSLGDTEKLGMGQSVNDRFSFCSIKYFRINLILVFYIMFSHQSLFCSSSFLNRSIL